MPLAGYPIGKAMPFVDVLSDEELSRLNRILRWNAFVADGRGRRFGALAWPGKRDQPAEFPNVRTLDMHQAFNLAGRTVLEIGCFEGIHTLGLCALGARVTAIDGRVENVVKAIVRTALCDYHPRILVCDVERRPLPTELLTAELCHHVGVLYHLQDPVRHLLDVGGLVSHGIMLDTHYAAETEARSMYRVDDEEYRYRRYGEYGRAEVFSGMADHSKWLALPSLLSALRRAGFLRIIKCEPRQRGDVPVAVEN